MFRVFGCWESSSRGWICKDTTSIKPNTPGSCYPLHLPLVTPGVPLTPGTSGHPPVCRMRVSALRGAICCRTFVSHCGLIILWLSGPVFTRSLLCAGIILGAMTWHQSPGRREGSWSANQRPVFRPHWPIRGLGCVTNRHFSSGESTWRKDFSKTGFITAFKCVASLKSEM